MLTVELPDLLYRLGAVRIIVGLQLIVLLQHLSDGVPLILGRVCWAAKPLHEMVDAQVLQCPFLCLFLVIYTRPILRASPGGLVASRLVHDAASLCVGAPG
jgi:hypothetical protein